MRSASWAERDGTERAGGFTAGMLARRGPAAWRSRRCAAEAPRERSCPPAPPPRSLPPRTSLGERRFLHVWRALLVARPPRRRGRRTASGRAGGGLGALGEQFAAKCRKRLRQTAGVRGQPPQAPRQSRRQLTWPQAPPPLPTRHSGHVHPRLRPEPEHVLGLEHAQPWLRREGELHEPPPRLAPGHALRRAPARPTPAAATRTSRAACRCRACPCRGPGRRGSGWGRGRCRAHRR